jgi:hypothetical protein
LLRRSAAPRLVKVRARVAFVGDENVAYPSHREINAVRAMLGADVEREWLPTYGDRVRHLCRFDGIWLTPGSPYADDSGQVSGARCESRVHGDDATEQ